METEEVVVAVRPRASLEAADLGFALARAYWRPLFGAHALVVLSFAFALCGAFRTRLEFAALGLWWLKPLYDRVALHVLSSALLGRAPPIAEVLAALPRLALRSGLFTSLTWLRLSPTRSFFAPVLQLEGLRGRARVRRVRVLAERESATAAGLMLVCSTVELAVVVAGLQLASTFWPQGSALEFWTAALVHPDGALAALELALYVLAICAVEPLYVAGGFALYINRRVWLEGWDVEVAFRRLERRVRARAAVGALVAVACLALPAGAAHAADDAPCKVDSPLDAGDCIDRVLASPEFDRTVKIDTWRPRGFDADIPLLSPLWRALGWLFSGASRVGIWLALPILLAFLFVAIARGVRTGRERRDARAPPEAETEIARSFDLRPEALPSDVVAAARTRFELGDAAGALSLLYRGALVELGRRFALRLPASATEGECERIARSALAGPLAQDFAALASAWLYCAYAHRPPTPPEFAALCARWTAGLGGRA
jgi:uncharacterized protein DUF4129